MQKSACPDGQTQGPSSKVTGENYGTECAANFEDATAPRAKQSLDLTCTNNRMRRIN